MNSQYTLFWFWIDFQDSVDEGLIVVRCSSCSGHYGENVSLDKLKEFHRRRLQVLVEAGPDLLAFETIPNKLEAQACVELLEEEKVQIPAWICFTSVDGEKAPSGESFEECLEPLNKSNNIYAVGINCAPPQFIENLIRKFAKASSSWNFVGLYGKVTSKVLLSMSLYVFSWRRKQSLFTRIAERFGMEKLNNGWYVTVLLNVILLH